MLFDPLDMLDKKSNILDELERAYHHAKFHNRPNDKFDYLQTYVFNLTICLLVLLYFHWIAKLIVLYSTCVNVYMIVECYRTMTKVDDCFALASELGKVCEKVLKREIENRILMVRDAADSEQHDWVLNYYRRVIRLLSR